MIIVNLVMGICLVAGGLKYGEQEFNAQGANAYLAMIVLLTGTALVLPNYLSDAGEFTTLQGWTIAAVTAALYAVFLLLQMRNEKRLFIQPHPGLMAVAAQPEKTAAQAKDTASAPGERSAIVRSSLLLLGMIIPIVLLAHHLAIVIDYGVATAGAPVAVSGGRPEQ
ncbi:hypothetical protein G6F57_020607 [Rhizopus arrhizus]|nr:hypothetical protein G6F57_020607 [Rhizopus arrhizus]